MRIDLGEEIIFEVVMGSEVYKLREPKLSEVKKFHSASSDDAFVDFIVELGMPRDVAEGLGVLKLKKLADGITGAISEKK